MDDERLVDLYQSRAERLKANGCKKWIKDGDETRCPHCNSGFPKAYKADGSISHYARHFNFCPTCGEPVSLGI
jgi:uncharacterized protein with PIN domain